MQMYHHVRWEKVEKKPRPVETVRQNLSLRGINNEIYHIGIFDGPSATMSDVLVLGFSDGVNLKSRVDAKTAKYENGRWIVYDGYLRNFDSDGNETLAQPFDRMPVDLGEKPEDFLKEQKEINEMTVAELITYVRQLKHNGSDCHKELVELHGKFAFPFGCVILALLGIPWGWSMGKYSGVILSVSICILVAFVYVGGMQIGQSLGDKGALSTFLAVWSPNILFALIAPFLLAWKNQ